MTSKKLGALLKTVPPATAAKEQSSSESAAQGQTPPSVLPVEDHVSLPAQTKAVLEPEVPLQVLIPASIRKSLALMAAEEGQSLRALMLRAIRGLGITVTDEQIKGKRGRKGP